MKNIFVVTRSDDYALEHSLEHASDSWINTPQYNSAYNKLQEQKAAKATTAKRAAAKSTNKSNLDTVNHTAEIEAKWDKLIDQQNASIKEWEKKYAQAKKDLDTLSRNAYSTSDAGMKAAIQKQAKTKQSELSTYTTNINAAKKVITSYQAKKKAEVAAEKKRYQKVMSEVAY